MLACASLPKSASIDGPLTLSSHRAAQNIKERPAQKLEPLGRAKGLPFGSCNGLFSAGFPTGVQGCVTAASTDPTNQLPTSHLGQAKWPPGSSTAHLQLFESSIGFSHLQLATGSCRDRQLRLAENINAPASAQADSPVGKASILWEKHLPKSLLRSAKYQVTL